MKLIYAGTPDFAAIGLAAVLEAGHEVVLVLTQPDRAAGRGLQPQPSAVKRLALARGVPVEQPASLRGPGIADRLRALQADALIVAAYGLILPGEILAVPRLGGINIHASLLPRWRGAAPIQRALIAGDTVTGITIMQMDTGLDTGPILLQEAVPITADDTARTLHDKLASLGARLIVQALANLPAPTPQNDAEATYAAKIDKREALLDWREPAVVLERKVRAFDPAPGAYTRLGGQPLKIWHAKAEPLRASEAAGTVVQAGAEGIVVATGDGQLRVLELQRSGGKRLAAAAFLAGHALPPGTRLGNGC